MWSRTITSAGESSSPSSAQLDAQALGQACAPRHPGGSSDCTSASACSTASIGHGPIAATSSSDTRSSPSSSRFWTIASPISSVRLVGCGHAQLPQQVVVEVRRLGQRVLDRRDLGQLGGAHAALGAVVEVVLEEPLDLDLLQRVLGPLALLGRLLLGDLLGRLRLLDRDLLEQRVLHHLLLEHLGELEGGERQELDRLLERRA